MNRITKEQVVSAFQGWLRATGGTSGHSDGKYGLDYAPIYGGWVIVRFDGGGGGTRQIGERCSAREFVSRLNFACTSLWEKPQRDIGVI